MGNFAERLPVKDIAGCVVNIASNYAIGEVENFSVIEIGYEDLNIKLLTSSGNYLLKIFSQQRKQGEAERYLKVLEIVSKTEIKTPHILKNGNGNIGTKVEVEGVQADAAMFEFIKCESLYDSNPYSIDAGLIRRITEQAALINSIEADIPKVNDKWACTNFLKEFELMKPELYKEDIEILLPVIDIYKSIPFEDLLICFCHGDLIKTNILMSDSEINIIDFSVADNYPRVQELAVLMSSTFLDKNSAIYQHNYEAMLKEYNKIIPLTKTELKILPDYVAIAFAMNFMCAVHELRTGNNSEENKYWVEQGKLGLSLPKLK